jgi:phosphoribosylaminoimidazole-succinocarboxamide synthase
MEDGMKPNESFPEPIITPATKAETGHDVDISEQEIIAQGIVSSDVYESLKSITKALFQRGTEMARERGLILVDTKYEFGWHRDQLYIIDEIHTPDSSRYWYADSYEEHQEKGVPQEQLSKEFVREWLMSKGFQGLEGQKMPVMDDEFVDVVSKRYIDLYERMTGIPFIPATEESLEREKMELAIRESLQS